MEDYYIIVGVLVGLKILFWIYFIYRCIRPKPTTRVIVSCRVITQATQAYTNNSSSIINSEPISVITPPPYDRKAKGRCAPPSYDYAVSTPGAARGPVASGVNVTCPPASMPLFTKIISS